MGLLWPGRSESSFIIQHKLSHINYVTSLHAAGLQYKCRGLTWIKKNADYIILSHSLHVFIRQKSFKQLSDSINIFQLWCQSPNVVHVNNNNKSRLTSLPQKAFSRALSKQESLLILMLTCEIMRERHGNVKLDRSQWQRSAGRWFICSFKCMWPLTCSYNGLFPL